MSVNKVILIGHTGSDPEIQTFDGGQTLAKVSLATNEYYRTKNNEKQQRTVWHRLVFWGKMAEVIQRYCKKGNQLYIEGRIDNRTYEDKEGKTQYISQVVVTSFQFLSSARNRDNTTQAPNQAPEAQANQPEFTRHKGYIVIEDDGSAEFLKSIAENNPSN